MNQAKSTRVQLQPESRAREGPRGPGASRGPAGDQGSTVDPLELQQNQGTPATQASPDKRDLKGP